MNLHPLALAYLRAVSDFHGRVGTVERWEDASEDWKAAGCPIEDDGTYVLPETRDDDTVRECGPSGDVQGASPTFVNYACDDDDPSFADPTTAAGDGDSDPD